MPPERSSRVGGVARHCATPLCVLRDETVTFANPAMGRLFDVEPDELTGDSFLALVAPDDRERVARALDSVEDDPVTVQFGHQREQSPPVVVESTWSRTDREGDARSGGDGDADSERSGGGKQHLVGSLRDVTDRVERERELERESEMLDSLLDNVPMSIYFKDHLSRHERVSTHLCCQDEDSCITNAEGKMHPHPDDVVGKTDWDIYGPHVAEDAIAEDQQVMESEEPIVDEVTESTTNLGQTFFSSTTKAPRYDEEGNVIGIVGVTMDVTDRLSSQRELERQNERLEEFTEVLAHDLRNPLNVAKAHVALLGDEYDDPSLGKVDESLDRMSTLIDEIRSFVIEGRTVESPDTVDLATIARDAWDAVDTDDADLDVPVTHRIEADPARLQRLFENVFRNAIEHGRPERDADADAETPAITVTVDDLADGFFVADDGVGIPDDRKADVFTRGFTTDPEGTGFGLAIVENIADAHDWDVAVTDSADGGAQFEFTGVVRIEDDANEHF